MGALVGGCYATNQLDTLEDWARSLTRRRIIGYLDVRIGGSGIIGGARLANRLEESIGDIAIEDMPIRFRAIATEIGTGHEVWLTRGSLALALRASYALPGIFAPVHLGGRWLVDGALVNPVPVSAARALGARVVIAVNMDADRFGRGATIASHGADAGDAQAMAPANHAVNGFARLRGLFGAERALKRHMLAGDARPGFLNGDDRIVQHHAGSAHPHAARRRSARRAHHAADRQYRLSRFSSRRRIHCDRSGRHRESDRIDYGIDRRIELNDHGDGEILRAGRVAGDLLGRAIELAARVHIGIAGRGRGARRRRPGNETRGLAGGRLRIAASSCNW